MTDRSEGLTDEEIGWIEYLRDKTGIKISTPDSARLVSLVDSLRAERTRAERAEAMMAQFGSQAAEAQRAWNGHELTLGLIAGWPEGTFPADTTVENIRERALAKVTQLREIAEAVENDIKWEDSRRAGRKTIPLVIGLTTRERVARWRAGRS